MEPPSDEIDPRNSLHHVLAAAESTSEYPAPSATSPAAQQPSDPVKDDSVAEEPIKEEEEEEDDDDGDSPDEVPAAAMGDSDVPVDPASPQYTSTTTTTRRNANGSVSSVYSGNKIRHLKKEDGVPLWRKDIQFDFLKFVFEDDKPVFHKASDKSPSHTFADIYLDAMAKSSKCSKILKEKLLTERPAALNMAMVCLLVNVGRMNTTLNFFPEMRAQLRTYHSIPSLQAHQDPNAYKQLQDAPRLKSILKGATEDVAQPITIDDIKAAPIPRTNPVNLIFVLAQFAPRISEVHFDVPRDFFDLVMKPTLSSRSRATAFLWLMWWYLESDFSLEAALSNPYGPGRRSRDADVEELPIKCPQFDYLTEEEAALENVDTAEELDFGELKRQERHSIITGDMQPIISGPKRTKKVYQSNPVFSVNTNLSTDDKGSRVNSPAPGGIRGKFRNKPIQAAPKQEYQSDSDQTRSASPAQRPVKQGSGMRITTLLNDENSPAPATKPRGSKGPGRGNWRRNRDHNAQDGAPRSQPKAGASDLGPSGPHGFYLPLNGADPTASNKRARPPTSHQLALERYRKERVNHILDRGLRTARASASRKRKRETPIRRSWQRCKNLPSGWDSEEEAHTTAAGRIGAAKLGLAMGGFRQNDWESPDWGEESEAISQAFRRMIRRLDRYEGGDLPTTSPARKGKRAAKYGAEDGDSAQPDEGGEMDVDEEEMGDEQDDEEEDDEVYGRSSKNATWNPTWGQEGVASEGKGTCPQQ